MHVPDCRIVTLFSHSPTKASKYFILKLTTNNKHRVSKTKLKYKRTSLQCFSGILRFP